MSADVFTLPNFSEPALYSRNNLAPITRTVKFALADQIGAAGSAADPIETGDVFKLFKLPPDVLILGGQFHSNALDSATSLDLDLIVTNGTTTKYIFDGLTVGRAGGGASSHDAATTGFMDALDANTAIGWVVDNDNYYLALSAAAGAAGAGAGDDIYITVQYTSALESNQAAFRT